LRYKADSSPVGRGAPDVSWLALLLVALLTIEGRGARGVTTYSHDHWDNFEYYTPMMAAAHGRRVSGDLPRWNLHQPLGESFLANPQMGTSYPPYTLAFLVSGWGGSGSADGSRWGT